MTEPIRRLQGLVLYHDGEDLLYSRGYSLYRSRDGGRSSLLLARLPRLTWRERLAVGALGARFFRSYIRHAIPWEGRVVALAGRRFFSVPLGEAGPKAVVAGAKVVGSQPFHLAVTSKGIYYGEYRPNPERTPVGLYRSVDGGLSFQRLLELSGVRHIHGVFTDPYNPGTLLVATGDDDEESAIWEYEEKSGTLRRLAGGSQQLRAVTLLPTEGALYFGSDTPRERNHIYRLDRHTLELAELVEVGGSVFWGKALPGGVLAFSTVVEPSEVNTTPFAELWVGGAEAPFTRRGEFESDRLHPKLFQYAQIRFPAGPGDEGVLWITPFANREHYRSVAIPVGPEVKRVE